MVLVLSYAKTLRLLKSLLNTLTMQFNYFLCLLMIVFLSYPCKYQIKTRFVLNKYDNFIPEPRAQTHNL